MPTKPLSRADARKAVDACDRAFAAGHPSPSRANGRTGRSALNAAAAALGVPRVTLEKRLKRARELHDLAPKWAALAPPPVEAPLAARARIDREQRLSNDLREAQREALAAHNLRRAVMGLAETPLNPPSWAPARDDKQGKGEAIILPISDVHMGEVIDLAQMAGRNAYNRAIARRRLERLFQNVVKLGTVHWSGPPPSVIYVALMGDLVSGEIHEELAKTNDLLAIPAVRDISECLTAGLKLLLAHFSCDVRVVSVPGNHGRTTRKPEAKGFVVDSYDTLVAWSLERWFAAAREHGDKAARRISFSEPPSGDALINIHGWNLLLTHGDRIGSRGGAGFVGVAATAARGFKRLVMDFAAEGVVIDKIIIGHFHTPLELEEGFVNGCVAGPSEYSRSGRMGVHPAAQWMLTVHPRHGVARRWLIQVGDPAEGSIYKGRA